MNEENPSTMKQDDGGNPDLVSGVMKNVPNKLTFLYFMSEE